MSWLLGFGNSIDRHRGCAGWRSTTTSWPPHRGNPVERAVLGAAGHRSDAHMAGTNKPNVGQRLVSQPSVETLESRCLMAADIYETDNTWQQAKTITVGTSAASKLQKHSIHTGTDIDWVKFTLTTTSSVLIETAGTPISPSGDTRMWLYQWFSPGLQQIAFSDDEGNHEWSQILRTGSQKLPAGTYYVKVDDYGNNSAISEYGLRVTRTPDFGLRAYREENWYWTHQRAPKSVGSVNTVLGNALGNCTWYAQGRAREWGWSATTLTAFNEKFANDWDDAAISRGLRVSRTPAVGAIAQWDRSGGGHVAIVEYINRDASGNVLSIEVSQSSYAGSTNPTPGATADYLYRRTTVSPGSFQDFILRPGTTAAALTVAGASQITSATIPSSQSGGSTQPRTTSRLAESLFADSDKEIV